MDRIVTDILKGIAFIVGYIMQDIKLALYIGLGGTLLTFIAVVPPWPIFNQNPVGWLPAAGARRSAGAQASHGITVDGKLVG